MENINTYIITPIPKPRMTQRDKWKQRPSVMRYRAFKDQVRDHRVTLPTSGAHIIFHIPMPKSWSKKKRRDMRGQGHQQTPDLDNLLKALKDALFDDDSHIWDYKASKVWALEGAIIISII